MANLLFADHYKITDKVSIRIPTVEEVLDNEEAYKEAVSFIVATPYDMMVVLDDAGIDFTKITSFHLFMLLLPKLQQLDTSLIFGDLDLKKYEIDMSPDTKEEILINREDGSIIDRPIHHQICSFLKKMLCINSEEKTPGNDEAKAYLLEKERRRLKRRKKKQQQESELESYIISLVNTAEFPYDYSSVRGISIYQLYSSLKQISHKIRYDNTMIGYYAGTVKFEDLSDKDKTWIVAG